MISIIALLIQLVFLSAVNSFTGNTPTIFIAVIILIQTVAIFYDITSHPLLHQFSIPIMLGYLMRLFFVFFDIYGSDIYSLPNSGADSEMYYRYAVEFVASGDAGRGGTFSTIMGALFSFAGTSRLYGQYIIMLFSIVAICLLPIILKRLDVDCNIIYGSVALVSLLPNFAILSSIFLRESLVTMLITISIYYFVVWFTNGREIHFLFAIIIAFASAALHSGSVALVMGYIVARLVYDKYEGKIQLKASNVIISVFFALLFVYFYMNYGDLFFSKMLNVSSLSDVSNTSTEGGSSYAQYVGNSNSILNMIIYTIPRIVFFLFSPFPWQWRGLSDIIAFIFSSCFYLITIIKIIKFGC